MKKERRTISHGRKKPNRTEGSGRRELARGKPSMALGRGDRENTAVRKKKKGTLGGKKAYQSSEFSRVRKQSYPGKGRMAGNVKKFQ